MITEAHTPQTKIKGFVRARTYELHAARCTSRHRHREGHILPRRNRQHGKTNIDVEK